MKKFFAPFAVQAHFATSLQIWNDGLWKSAFLSQKNSGLVRNLEVSPRIFSLFITCPGLGCMPGGKGCLNWICCWGIPGVPWGGGCWDPGPPSNPDNKTKINQMISEQKINQMISEAFPISKVYETEVRKTERMQSETILALEKGPRPVLFSDLLLVCSFGAMLTSFYFPNLWLNITHANRSSSNFVSGVRMFFVRGIFKRSCDVSY